MKYKYETVSIRRNIWTGKSSDDFLQVINERGEDGWRFVTFAPVYANPKGVKGIELIFEKAEQWPDSLRSSKELM